MEESLYDDREEFGRMLFDRDANLFGRFRRRCLTI
jgi:hypothetical protein